MPPIPTGDPDPFVAAFFCVALLLGIFTLLWFISKLGI